MFSIRHHLLAQIIVSAALLLLASPTTLAQTKNQADGSAPRSIIVEDPRILDERLAERLAGSRRSRCGNIAVFSSPLRRSARCDRAMVRPGII
jgi:hypothetical protein